jgi:hypothetical protein
MLDRERLDAWYDQYEDMLDIVYDSKTGATYRSSPQRIMNSDETGFQRMHRNVRGVAEQRQQHIYRWGTDNKVSITAFCSGLADGVLVIQQLAHAPTTLRYHTPAAAAAAAAS